MHGIVTALTDNILRQLILRANYLKVKYPDYIPYSEERGRIPIRSTVYDIMRSSPSKSLWFEHPEPTRTNTFTHYANDYDLDKLNEILQDAPVSKVNIVDLIWIFDHCTPDPRRMALVDLKVPIYVTRSEDRPVAVDGLHRLSLAYVTGRNTLPAKMVTQEMLDQVKIS